MSGTATSPLRRAFLVMLAATGICGAIAVTTPRLTPPGNVWSFPDTLATTVLLVGAFLAGWQGLRWYEAGTLAAVGAAFIGVWLPDSRDCLGMAMGGPPMEWYLRNYFLFMAGMGASCAVVAHAAGRLRPVVLRYTRRDESKCQTCGYDLRGLPEPRCPECGAPFDPTNAPPLE